MKAAFTPMGYTYVNLGAIFRHIGLELCMEPRPARKALSDGVRHAPEQFCIPFKVNLGGLIASLESGAELLATVQGAWSCRFGYYGRLHHAILRDMGYEFDSLIVDGSKDCVAEICGLIKRVNDVRSTAAAARIFFTALRIGFKKGKLLQAAQTWARKLRPVEALQGSAQRVFDRIVDRIDSAETFRSLGRLEGEMDEAFRSVRVVEGRSVVKMMVLGEVYIVLEPLVNMDAVRKLGEMGVLVDTFIDEHRWILHPFRLGVRGRYQERHAHRLATPYLKYNLGGEDKNTIGYSIIAAQRHFDGVVHFKPFTCMPEGVAKHILFAVSRDCEIPIMSFTVDEHSGEAGMLTRLEAFTDMLRQRADLGRGTDMSTGLSSAQAW